MAGKYNKTPLSIQDQAQLLLNRGLVCTDTKRLEQYLTSIGYYRLSVYWLPFEQHSSNGSRNHQFVPNTNFDEILKLYIFDRKLRLLIMEAIERIEVALRSQWSGTLALLNNDSHAYMNPLLFKCPRQHIICRTSIFSKRFFIHSHRFGMFAPITAAYGIDGLQCHYLKLNALKIALYQKTAQTTKQIICIII